MGELSVVIPARNASATLPGTLAGLEAQDQPGSFEVVVVDDGSQDETSSVAARSSVVSQVLRQPPRGPAAARNAGAAAAAGSRLAFLDADCRPTRGWLRAGGEALRTADLVLGEVRPDPEAHLGPFDRTLWVSGLSPLHESANLFVRRELFDRLGGFESWLGPVEVKELGEDVWFGWRARRQGARLAADSQALAYHAVFPRSAGEFIQERWRLRFFPAMARRIPELRSAFFYRRVFLSRRSAAFDAGAAAALGALTTRRPLLLAAAGPYVLLLREDWRRAVSSASRVSPTAVCAAHVAADAVGAAAMVAGSLRSRSLLL